MSIWRWFMWISTPGSTARWAAACWKRLRSYPEFAASPPAELLTEMILARYRFLPNEEKQNRLLALVPQMKGLGGVVFSVLSVEAGLLDCRESDRDAMMSVAVDELLRKGVTEHDVLGTHWPRPVQNKA